MFSKCHHKLASANTQSSNTMMKKTAISLALLGLSTPSLVWAEQQLAELAPIQVDVEHLQTQTQRVDHQTLKQSATQLGDILSTQTGIHANQFGGGASAPVIHGQDSHRIKILHNSADVVDMSHTSPDHAIAVDAVLAKHVDIVQGVDVLRYGSGITGAVVNVSDEKILSQMPSQMMEGEVGLRFNTGNDEKLAHAGVSVGLGSNLALRVQGLTRKANNYRVANVQQHGDEDGTSHVVENTMAKGTSGSIGLSWIGEQGHIGIAYSERKEKYGLPGHSHEYHDCSPFNDKQQFLAKFNLDDDGHCAHNHDDDNHHDDEHAHADPIVDLKSKRYDLQAEYLKPIKGIAKVNFTADYTNYKHDEVEEEPVSFFRNKGTNARLELTHQPIGKLTGHFGVQYGKNTMSITGEESLMNEATTTRLSAFAVEQLKWKDIAWRLAGRVEHHKINTTDPAMKDYKKTAYSYGTGVEWQISPHWQWFVSATHQQRIPTALEMYAKGAHLASNTWELGNDQYQLVTTNGIKQRLTPEKSNNVELGFHYKNNISDYKVSGFYKDYDGYLYAKTLDRQDNFRLIRYHQADAKFYGIDFNMGSQLTPRYHLAVFGDMVRGKIEGLNAPRMPAYRVGYRVKADFGQGVTGSVETLRTFDQIHYADFETKTAGYQVWNVGLDYSLASANQRQYHIFFKGNNLFDKPVYSHSSFLANIPQMGRNFSLGINFKF